ERRDQPERRPRRRRHPWQRPTKGDLRLSALVGPLVGPLVEPLVEPQTAARIEPTHPSSPELPSPVSPRGRLRALRAAKTSFPCLADISMSGVGRCDKLLKTRQRAPYKWGARRVKAVSFQE